MLSHDKTLEDLLATLGSAHRQGAFSGESREYPWQTASTRTSRLAGGFRWVRVAVPLAAAAAVAVLFVGPGLFGNRAVQDASKDALAAIHAEHPDVLADAEAVTTGSTPNECDYNGDGVVDGKDIQAFLDRMQDPEGDPLLQAERLQRCLLGS